MTPATHPAARPEHERNRLLRRVDWRWLLPQPEVERAVARVDDALLEALAAVASEVRPVARARPGGAALAVLLHPGVDDLRAARRALAPQGVLYAEWRRPRPAGVAAALRALRGAGFEAVALQWSWPAAAGTAPTIWLPLDRREAVGWLRGRRPPGRGGAWARRVVADGAFTLARRAGALAPLCVVARPAGTGLEPWLTGLLHDHRGGEGSSPGWLLLTGGRRSHNKVVGLPFAPGARRPELAVKVGRVAEAETGLRREERALRALASASPAAAALAPTVLFLRDGPGPVALGQSLEEGVPLLSELTPARYPRVAEEVTDLLIGLARTTAQPVGALPHPVAAAAARGFARAYASVLSAAERMAVEAHPGHLPALPTVIEQRDCSPWNLLRRPGGGLVMLDWESAEPRGLPLLDLVYFLTFAGLHLHGAIAGAPGHLYGRVWGDSPEGRVNAACVARYLAALGLPGSAAGALRRIAWMVHAEVEFERLTADRGRPPAPADLLGGVFLRLLRADGRGAGVTGTHTPWPGHPTRAPGRAAARGLRGGDR